MKKKKIMYTVLLAVFALIVASCSMFLDPKGETAIPVSSMKLSKSSSSIGVGGMDYLGLSLNPSSSQASASIKWTSSPSGIISIDATNSGAAITGLANGNTTLRVESGGVSTVCLVSVIGVDPGFDTSPQITSSTIALELESGTSRKVQVSLTGGNSIDMASFTWSIDKSSIATVEGAGQTAYINAKQNGVAQVTVRHSKATYPYQFTVFVKPDSEKSIYITTQQNILTLNREAGETEISVSLVNGENGDSPFFVWEKLDTDESDASCIDIEATGENAVITPLKQGTSFLRVTHPKAAYAFDIRVRVITIVENVYIEPDKTQVTLQGTSPQTIEVTLQGATVSDGYSPDEFVWAIEDDAVAEISSYQNQSGVIGLKNGQTKITITHPAAKYARDVLVIVENHPSGSIDGGMYITTTQSYIRTKVGAADIDLSVLLVGGEPGDEANFEWTNKNPSIIDLQTVNGSVFSRRAFDSFSSGKAIITPQTEGTAIISVSHPKIITPTDILVKVLPQSAILEEPLYFIAPSFIGLVRGTNDTVEVELMGENKEIGDDSSITWTAEPSQPNITIEDNGTSAVITANQNGQTFINLEHPKVENPKKIIVFIAETQEELDEMKILYADKYFYNIVAGTTDYIHISQLGLDEASEGDVQWASNALSIATVASGINAMQGVVTAISAGTAVITASHPDCAESLEFTITVLPVGTDVGVIPSPTYLITSQNVVQFTELNKTKTVSVTPIKLTPSEYPNIVWTVEDESICSVVPNGASATITSLTEGTTKILVSHRFSENELPITVRVGDEYVDVSPKTPYISVNPEVLGLINGGQGSRITATLANSSETSIFTWVIDDISIATITPLGASCFVVPKSPGQAQITITNNKTALTKKVLVLVANSDEELASIPYLTTAQNLVSLKLDTQQTLSVRMTNKDAPLQSGYSWQVMDNPSFVQIISSGQNATLKGLAPGIAHVQVRHTDCTYPLEIIVEVTEQGSDASHNPYITTSQNIITTIVGNTNKLINVTLAGGTDDDNKDFTWSIDRSDVIRIVPNAQNAYITGIAEGECLVTVSHPKADYTLPIKILVEPKSAGTSLYIKTSPANIITMRPADQEVTVTASLVGGTAEDAYGFTWYADNYNCIELTATANTAVITPKAEGTAIITIEHPKAGFSGKLQVRITEYSTFEFAVPNMSIIEGQTQFISMRVPAIDAEYDGRVVYSTDNERIVTITGTNKVSQLTAVGPGTATVTATSPSGAESDMLVYVKKAAEQTLPYITTATNVLSLKSTDNQRSVSATLTGQGVTATDQYNLQWEIDNPAVARLIGTSGTSVFVKPVGPGETTLKISHPKTESFFSMHIAVSGTAGGISLDRTYVALETGKTIELEAKIDNGTTADFNNITWSVDKVNGQDICSVMGGGKTVGLLGLATGRTKVTAEWEGNTVVCDVVVAASRQFMFDTQTMRVQPGQTKTFKYTLIPDNADIQWFTTTNDYMTYSVDPASKTISITGIAESPTGSPAITTLSAISQSMKAQISITTAWDYKLTLGKSQIKSEPRPDPTNPGKFIIPYTVNPSNARIEAVVFGDNIADVVVDVDKKEIHLTPTGEGIADLRVTAYNTNVSPEKVFPSMMRECGLNFKYDKITLEANIVEQIGRFSDFNDALNFLTIGDGEQVTLKFDSTLPNATFSITNVRLERKVSNSPLSLLEGEFENSHVIEHPTDHIEKEYLIEKWYDPVQDGVVQFPTTYRWRIFYGGTANSEPFYTNDSWGISAQRDSSKDNTRIAKSTYESTGWWYQPYKKAKWTLAPGKDNNKYFDAKQTRNNPAKLVDAISEEIQSSIITDYIVVILSHGTKTETVRIPVKIETRACKAE